MARGGDSKRTEVENRVSGLLEFGEENDGQPDLPQVWQLCLALLSTRLSPVIYHSFLVSARPLRLEQNCFVLGVASSYARDQVQKKASNAIRSALEFHLDRAGLQVEIELLSPETAASEPETRDTIQPPLPLEAEPSAARRSAPPAPRRTTADKERTTRRADSSTAPAPIPGLPLNDRYRFHTFLTGHSNRLAHACALSAAENPGTAYNPLFLYGGPGLGKSHLLHAIAHHIRERKPQARVAYVSGEVFAQQYITSLREHATEDFRRLYRDIDVWLVDDIQFIAGKERTNEEFFHTFNTLYQSGRQVVFASDRSPRDLNMMDERLRTRFQSGLIADLAPPEMETRLAILQQFRDRENSPVRDDVLEYIASAIQSNIRALEGAFTRLMAHCSIMNVAPGIDLARNVLSEYFIARPLRNESITTRQIIELAAAQFGVTPQAIIGPSRNKDLSLARQVAMYLSRELLPEQNTTITGELFGGRDHATIVYACKHIRQILTIDPELNAMTERMKRTLQEL